MIQSSITPRRDFLKRTSIAAVSMAASGWTSLVRGESPNDRLRVGVIGAGVRGKYLIGNLPKSARVTAICDCAMSHIADTLEPRNQFKDVLASFCGNDARRCVTYKDYRKMFDGEKLDAVIIATPDHHHAQAGLLALDAGLDVYLEKPLAVTIREGRLLVDKVNETGRILQVGSQQRTMEINRFACEFIRDGGLGKISHVELPNYPGPISNQQFHEEAIPKGLDWKLFIGPAPMRPHNRKLWVKDDFKVGNLVWRGWDLFRDYSGHIMTNWGAHSVDMMQYALGRDNTGPVSIQAFEPESVETIYNDWAHKTPKPLGNHERRFWPVKMHYADGVAVTFLGPNAPMVVHGERGTMKIRRNYFEVDPPELITDGPGPGVVAKWAGGGHVARPHLQNWLECIRSRNVPNAPVEVGHRTVTVCHLANIARELNRPLKWKPNVEQFTDDDAANQLIDRPRQNGFELTATRRLKVQTVSDKLIPELSTSAGQHRSA